MTPPPAEHLTARVFLGPTLRAQPDRRLVDLVRNGYDAAFEEIVRRYRRQLDRFAAAIVGGRSEDVTQDAFSKALPALRRSEAEIELRPWLYRIVRNTALNDLRDRGPAPEELRETMPGARSAAAVAESRQELRDLMDRLRALPEPQRAALVMRELEGLSHEEIAAALGLSGGAARQAIYRARAALRDGLGLLVPMPVLRALADHADDAARAGGAIAAGTGASTAGGAALGGIGGGALKVGMATVLIAGTVGAGVAIDHQRGGRSGPEAAEAAPLEAAGPAGGRASGGSGDGGSSPSARRGGDGGQAEDGRRGDGSGGGGASLGDGDRSGSNGGSGVSGGRSGHSGHDGGGRTGSGEDSGPGSISGGHHSGDDDGPDDDGGSGSGSDDSGFEDGGSSGPGSGDDGLTSGEEGGSSGPGSGELESEPAPTTSEPEVEDGGDSGSGGGSSGPGSGELSGVETSGVDGSP